MAIERREGPFLKGAFLCDTVIEGKDGANSYIRVVDQLTVGASLRMIGVSPPGVPRPTLPDSLPEGSTVAAWLVIMISGGGAQGRQPLALKMRGPDGIVHDLPGPLDVVFDGRQVGGGTNFHFNLQMGVTLEGAYEILAYLDGREFAHVPFSVLYRRM